jgi:uncharacterized protein YndB with AHSA1/START domain
MTADAPAHSLTLTREIDAPPEKLFKAWTTPDLMKEWFCPKPWKVVEARLDLKPGGSCFVLMQGPEGEQMPNPGIYLEVVPSRKLVFTDAYTSAWVPAEKPFMTGVIEFEDLGNGRTKYTATAVHWSEEDKKAHEEMGFHEGWGIATDQLAAIVKTF